MSDTPRTDANESITCKGGDKCIAPDFARILELENNAMREAIKDAHFALDYVYNHGEGSCAFPFRVENDLYSENRFHHVNDALDALKPFIKP